MKQSLYKVPDGFFEKAELTALARAREIRRRRVLLLCTPLIVAIAFFSWSRFTTPTQDYVSFDECDVFLEVFEY